MTTNPPISIAQMATSRSVSAAIKGRAGTQVSRVAASIAVQPAGNEMSLAITCCGLTSILRGLLAQIGRALRAANRLYRNVADTVRALFSGRRRRGLLEAVRLFHNEEHDEGNHQKIGDRVNELSIGDHGRSGRFGRRHARITLAIQARKQVFEIDVTQ